MPASVTSKRVPAQSTQPHIQTLAAEKQARQQDWRRLSDAINNGVIVGTLAQQPATSQGGQFFFATDTGKLYIGPGDGTWFQVN